MSNVIAFTTAPKPRAALAERSEGAPILFFTGVRYVRATEGETQPPEAASCRSSQPVSADADHDRNERRQA